MQRTRRQILDILKQRGRATLEDLAREVGLSPVTVRVHLSVLQRDDLVNVDEIRGKVGRPYFVYSLTEEAEELFPKRYHVLAARLLRTMNDELPADTVARVLSQVAAGWAGERAERVKGKPLCDRVAEVTEIRNEEGALAEWAAVNGGYRLTQHNCPNLLVSRGFPQVCDVEHGYLEGVLDAQVVQTECIGRGDRVCSFEVSERPAE
ncbi:MAG TPA: winged helix-turn-helix transcriptional regulator [Chloroflexota bacterium]